MPRGEYYYDYQRNEFCTWLREGKIEYSENPDLPPYKIKPKSEGRKPKNNDELLKAYLDEYQLLLDHAKGNDTESRYIGHYENLIKDKFYGLTRKSLLQRIAALEKEYGELPKLTWRWAPGRCSKYPHKMSSQEREKQKREAARVKKEKEVKAALQQRLNNLLGKKKPELVKKMDLREELERVVEEDVVAIEMKAKADRIARRKAKKAAAK